MADARAAAPRRAGVAGRAVLRALLVVPLVVLLSLRRAVLVGPSPWPWTAVASDLPGAPAPGDHPADADVPAGPAHRRAGGGPHPARPAAAAPRRGRSARVRHPPGRRRHPGGLRPLPAGALRHPAGRRARRAARRSCTRRSPGMSEVTGLQFVHDGATDEPRPSTGRSSSPTATATAGRRCWSPGRPRSRTPRWPGTSSARPAAWPSRSATGRGSSSPGTVSLDAGRLPEILALRDGDATARAIVLHELGHLVGLAHVDDAGAAHVPRGAPRGPRLRRRRPDRTGRASGSGACVPEL